MINECLDDDDLRVRIFYFATKCNDVLLHRFKIEKMNGMGAMMYESHQMETVRQGVSSTAGEAIRSAEGELDHLTTEVSSLKLATQSIANKKASTKKTSSSKKKKEISSESSSEEEDDNDDEEMVIQEEPSRKKTSIIKLNLGRSKRTQGGGGMGGDDLPFALNKKTVHHEEDFSSDYDSEACLDR